MILDHVSMFGLPKRCLQITPMLDLLFKILQMPGYGCEIHAVSLGLRRSIRPDQKGGWIKRV